MKPEPDSANRLFLKQIPLLAGSPSLAVPHPDSYRDGAAFCFTKTPVHGQ
ncbi:MAG: hypothetical protein K0R51_609 [Cytophagaceae bacterium]|jgi:hypothetical protein|nr:hypothetical protein [Cytophagaceae bacterium]